MKIQQLYFKYRDRLPSWLWMLIMLCGILLVIVVPIGIIYVLSHFEGVASVIFLVLGWFVFGNFAKQEKRNPMVIGGAVLFFALMGMSIDQTGNIIYNQPMALSCPEGTIYNRSVTVLHPLPGRTDFFQNFQCLDEKGKTAYGIPIYMVLLTRFIEYILIAYLLLGIRIFINKIWKNKEPYSC
jgi:hypothetical protein